jgi:uncharacterized protein YndB with AHSA1/START domain
MPLEHRPIITVESKINASLDKVWECWNDPEQVKAWNNASQDWHTPSAENDFREGGSFVYRMEAKDGSVGFDFAGTYDSVRPKEYIEYTLADGRKVNIRFSEEAGLTNLKESFEAEDANPVELQQQGWQAILDNFKRYVEGQG